MIPYFLSRCRKEIQTKLGMTRASVSDMPRLPYLMATITEVQRVSRVAPMSLPHKTLATTTVGGYSFPAGSVFHANISAFMNDHHHFHRPERFKPDRFINTEGKYVLIKLY